jgi:uncharacterized membrane protein
MSDAFGWLKLVHIVSATVLFGTGLGTAFHMWMAHLSRDARAVAIVARNVVLADAIFTTPSVVVQPASGIALLLMAGYDPFSSWLVATYVLYIVAGGCWLVVVWLQLRIRDLARVAAMSKGELPAEYHRRMWLWFTLGWPAFAAVVAIFWLMVTKPDLW